MKITLPLELQQFVENKVKGGSYLSESEVVADALRRLIECEHPLSSDRLGQVSALPVRLLFTLHSLKEQLSEVENSINALMSQTNRRRREEEARIEESRKLRRR